MNEKLVRAYIAHKAAKCYESFAFAKATMSSDAYQHLVLSREASEFPEDMLQNAKTVIMNRFNIKEHNALFNNPTLYQWIKDVLGTWTPNDIFDIISEKFHEEIDLFDFVSSESEMLDIIELLEKATGKSLCDIKMLENPMTFLGDITYNDLAIHFAS